MNFLKLRKFKLKGIKINKKKLNFGFYGLKALETGRLDTHVLDSFNQTILRKLKPKGAKFWSSINPSINVTKTSTSSRMGKGKGSLYKKIAFVRKGQIFCEISFLKKKDALHILKMGSSKLPIKTKLVIY